MVILLAEDEQKLALFLKNALEREHYTVELASDGQEASDKVKIYDYDLVVLDVMLPKKDGFEVCREIRGLGLNTKIMMLTGKKMAEDKVIGLDTGADDYMVKPFETSELLARIRALSRRQENYKSNTLKVGDLTLDTVSHETTRGAREIKLTSKEYRILEYLMRNPGTVCTRTMINEHIWGFNYVKSNIIDVYITRLRQKIDGGEILPLIHTVHGSGYKLKA